MRGSGSGGGRTGIIGLEPRPAPTARPADPGEVLGIAAHELRQPASVIYGLATTLKHQRGDLSDEQMDEVVHRLHRQAERLVGVLEETLDLDRIRRTEVPPILSEVRIASAVDQALLLAPPPPGVRVSVGIPPGLEVLAAPAGLERILVNLLSNAYRYGGPHIRIDGRATPAGVRLTVADDGPGVPDDLVGHLFQPFRAQPGGHGLGLSIVLGLAESFGGTVSYRRGDPTGAEFELTLRSDAAQSSQSRAEHAGVHDEPATILVVDDESDIRWLLRLALEAAGYRVVEASHGQEALEAILQRPPTLIVSDLMMPVMDGNELSRRVRAMPGSADLPILVLSANPDLAQNADRVVRKPCNIGDLTRAVADLLEGDRP